MRAVVIVEKIKINTSNCKWHVNQKFVAWLKLLKKVNRWYKMAVESTNEIRERSDCIFK